jgi:hypothetical protein
MKTVARELMWLLIAILLAVPMGYLFGTILELEPEADTATTIETVFEMELFIIGAIIGFVLTYVMRVLMWAISKQLVSLKS